MISVVTDLRQRQGFTLIELMIVVAIIGILSTIAIPNMMKFQLRTRASEGRLNLSAIRTAQKPYFSETGFFQPWALTPAAPPTALKRPMTLCPNTPPQFGDPGYCFIGWFPEGDVYYNYIVTTNAPANQFFAVGESDIDGDGSINLWGIQEPDPGNNFAIAATQGCNQVLNPELSQSAGAPVPMRHQVGPCDNPSFGIQVF